MLHAIRRWAGDTIPARSVSEVRQRRSLTLRAGILFPAGRLTARREQTSRRGTAQGVKPMQIFDLASIAAECAQKQQTWSEFLRVPSLSVGLDRLQAWQ